MVRPGAVDPRPLLPSVCQIAVDRVPVISAMNASFDGSRPRKSRTSCAASLWLPWARTVVRNRLPIAGSIRLPSILRQHVECQHLRPHVSVIAGSVAADDMREGAGEVRSRNVAERRLTFHSFPQRLRIGDGLAARRHVVSRVQMLARITHAGAVQPRRRKLLAAALRRSPGRPACTMAGSRASDSWRLAHSSNICDGASTKSRCTDVPARVAYWVSESTSCITWPNSCTSVSSSSLVSPTRLKFATSALTGVRRDRFADASHWPRRRVAELAGARKRIDVDAPLELARCSVEDVEIANVRVPGRHRRRQRSARRRGWTRSPSPTECSLRSESTCAGLPGRR